MGGDLALAWPTAEIAVMGPEGAANIVYRKEIQAAENPEAERAARIQEYKNKYANPYIAASRGWVDAVIDPRETRSYLIRGLEMLATKQEDRPRKNMAIFLCKINFIEKTGRAGFLPKPLDI